MSTFEAEAVTAILFYHDDETPLQFVIELLHSVFKKQLADALRFTEAVRKEEQASCGSYPRDIANEMLEAARERIDAFRPPAPDHEQGGRRGQ